MKPPTLKQLKNEKALTIYAGFLCGIILSVIAARYLHGYYNKVLDSKCSHALQDPSHRTRAPVFRYVKCLLSKSRAILIVNPKEA